MFLKYDQNVINIFLFNTNLEFLYEILQKINILNNNHPFKIISPIFIMNITFKLKKDCNLSIYPF